MGNHKDSPLLKSGWLRIESWREVALWFGFWIVPLVIGLTWGIILDDSAYVTFRYARNLAAGCGLTYNCETKSILPVPSMVEGSELEGGRTLLRAPLYVLVLSVPARLGISLPQASLILSALGWGMTAVAIYSTGRAMHRPVAAVVSAALAVFNPVVVSTLGTEISWTVALAWGAITASMKKWWNIQIGVLALMLCAHFDLSTLTLAVLLLVIQWIERRHFPLHAILVLAIITFGWGLADIVYRGLSVSWITGHWSSIVDYWPLVLRQLVDESEFYWLFLPLFLYGGAGLLSTTRRALGAGLLWGAWGVASILSGTAAAEAMMTTLGLFLVGLGIDWAIKWIEMRDVVLLNRLTLMVGLALAAGLPLGIAQTSSLVQRYRFRPVIRQELERQAADWLQARSGSTTTVLGSEMVGYLANCSTRPWNGSEVDPARLANLIKALSEDPPEYCITFESLSWDYLMQTSWFQNDYMPLQKFESPYEATSPCTIWGYRVRTLDLGEYQPLDVRLPGQVYWVGYRYWPNRVRPGDAVNVTLFAQVPTLQLQAPQFVTEPFQTVARVVSLHDDMDWARQDTITSRSVLVDEWRTGQVIGEQLVLTTTADIPVGVYRLEVSVVSPDSRSVLPMYQHYDTFPLDRILLGYVAVPWQGELDVDRAKPMDANFGNQISLLGFEVVDSLIPGAEFDVGLYWEAQRSPEDDYVVFVHLLDTNDNQAVASHDGQPMDGRYITSVWLPGEIVLDVHHMVLAPNTPEGTYQLQVGMYHWPSLERLPVWDRQGAEQLDRAIVLQSIAVKTQ